MTPFRSASLLKLKLFNLFHVVFKDLIEKKEIAMEQHL